MDLSLWVELALFSILIVFSGFFSSSETSFFSLGRLELEQMRRDDNPRLDLIERMLSEPRRLIVTILIGNELANVAASVISAAIVIQLLGAENRFVNLLVMVPVLLLFGEITPKTLAIRNNVAFATFQSLPLEMFAVVIRPLRRAVRLVADWLTTVLVGKERAPGSIVTEDMVRALANEAVGEGVLDDNEAQYVDRVFNYGHKTVGDLRTPRSHIFYLPAQMPLRQMVTELRKTRHTKVPVYDGHRDNVLGLLYARDLVGEEPESLDHRPNTVTQYLREPYLVPETKRASELFHTFRRRKLSVALTVDEYGGVTGLVSMEDLLECIFGDIPSPSDEVTEVEYMKLPDGRTRIDATMRVNQFNRLMNTSLEADESETVAGLLLRTYGELPAEATEIVLGAIEFEVNQVKVNRIVQVTARKTGPHTDSVEVARDSGPPEGTREADRSQPPASVSPSVNQSEKP